MAHVEQCCVSKTTQQEKAKNIIIGCGYSMRMISGDILLSGRNMQRIYHMIGKKNNRTNQLNLLLSACLPLLPEVSYVCACIPYRKHGFRTRKRLGGKTISRSTLLFDTSISGKNYPFNFRDWQFLTYFVHCKSIKHNWKTNLTHTYIKSTVKDSSWMLIFESHAVGRNIIETDCSVPGWNKQKLRGIWTELDRWNPIIWSLIEFELVWSRHLTTEHKCHFSHNRKINPAS